MAIDTGFGDHVATRSRTFSFLLVLCAHVLLIGALATFKHNEPVAPIVPAIEAQLTAEQADPTQAPPLPPATLETPPTHIPIPEVNVSLSAPDAVVPTEPAAASPSATTQASQAPAIPAEPTSDPRFDAAYLKNPAPLYPPASRSQHEQGTVLLKVRVSEKGAALEVQIDRTSGFRALDEAAVRAVRLWRFVPALRSTTPLEAWVLIPVEFSLHH